MITSRWLRLSLFLSFLALLALSSPTPGAVLAQDAPASTSPVDTVPPAIGQPGNLMVAAADGSGTAVTYAIPTATDETDGPIAVACAPASGAVFPLGTTLITCGAQDAAGNQAAVTFTITVTDQTPPVITWPADIVVDAVDPAGAVVNYAVPAAVDNVNGPVAAGCDIPTGSLFPVGTTAVTCYAQDAAGNAASPVTFYVTVNAPAPPPPPPTPTSTPAATPPSTATQDATAPEAVDTEAAAPTETATATKDAATETATTSTETATPAETPSSTPEAAASGTATAPATETATQEATATATEPPVADGTATELPSATSEAGATETATTTAAPATDTPAPGAVITIATPPAAPVATPSSSLITVSDAAAEIEMPTVIEVPTPKPTPTQTTETVITALPEPTAIATVDVPAALELPWPPPADFILVTDGGPIDGLSAIWNNQEFPISQEFGHTSFSIQHFSWYAYGMDYGLDGYEHPGIDIAMPAGTPLYSPVDGVVKVAGGVPYYTYYGNGQPGVGELLIETADGNEVILGHMGRITVEEGQQVKAGQFVGLSGGDNGDHLHLETREIQPWNGYRIVDPRHSFLVPALEQVALQNNEQKTSDDGSADRRTV